MVQKETQIMKKNIRLIVIFCVIAAVLAGLLIFLLATAPEEEEESTPEEKVTSRLMYDRNPADISEITIENEYGSYKVTRVGEGDSAAWSIEGISELPINSSDFTSIIENAAALTAQQTVAENPEDISIYGLDVPSAKVTSVYSDSAGTVNTLILGNLVPDGINRYFMLEGDPKVYTVKNSSVRYFLDDKYDLVNKVVYTVRTASGENDTTDYTRINKMTIKRADLDYDVVIEYDVRIEDDSIMTGNSSNYVMTEPAFRDLNPQTSSEITGGIFGLTASKLGIVHPDETDMEITGINSPSAEVAVEINGGDTLNFRIGNESFDNDGEKLGRYVYAEGIDIIYIFEESSLPWLNFVPIQLVTSMLTSNYVYDLEALDITTEDKELNFTMTGTSASDFAVKLNGTDVDSEAFKTLYQFILRAPSDDFWFEDNGEEPVLTISIRTYNGNEDIIEFIPSESRRSLVRLNGKITYRCASAYVERLIRNLELYENGQDIITNW